MSILNYVRHLTMYDNLILTDVDGVLLNWEADFHRYMLKNGYIFTGATNAYSMEEMYHHPSKGSAVIDELITEFNSSYEFGNISPYVDAIWGVKKLYEKHGIVFHTISKCGNLNLELRRKNLNKIFGDAIIRVTCLNRNESKHSALSEYKDSGYFWIEDNPAEFELGKSLGLTCILMDAPYNKEIQTDYRVTDWKGVIAHVIG